MKEANIAEADVAAVATILEQSRSEIIKTATPSWLHPSAVKVIHCVLSLNRNYDKVVSPRLDAFMDNHPDIQGVVELANLMDSYPTPHAFAKQELNYNHKDRAQILRSVVEYTCSIVEESPIVSEEETLKQWAVQANPLDYKTLGIKGFAIAGFQYLRMLCGAGTVKPDRHIMEFLCIHLGRSVPKIESIYLLEAAAERVGLSVRTVDLFIWNTGARGTGTNTVRLAPDVAAAFPNEEAVNEALRSVLKKRSKKV